MEHSKKGALYQWSTQPTELHLQPLLMLILIAIPDGRLLIHPPRQVILCFEVFQWQEMRRGTPSLIHSAGG